MIYVPSRSSDLLGYVIVIEMLQFGEVSKFTVWEVVKSPNIGKDTGHFPS